LNVSSRLIQIKLLHTAVWIFFVVCIFGIPIAAWRRQFFLAAVLSALVWIECIVLAVNHGRCPLTDVAGSYTEERVDNFDIYLPRWLAKYNKLIFGMLFALGELFAILTWRRA
jgi:hypothetical protein